MTPDVQARLLCEALAELGVERPLLVRQSWGGVVALAYALDYPKFVSGVVLMGVAPYPRERATDPFFAIARAHNRRCAGAYGVCAHRSLRTVASIVRT